MFLRAIIADSHLCLRVRPNAIQITVNYSATSNTEVDTLELSMGMSNDFAKAIQFGATYLRVGSAIFGNRS